MTAAMLVLEPIFEARPSTGTLRLPSRAETLNRQVVNEVEELLFRGHPEVVDADLADYFGSIPHAELLKSVSRRIVDRRVLHPDQDVAGLPRGRYLRRSRTDDAHDRGARQAARDSAGLTPISPLLANIYMRRFVLQDGRCSGSSEPSAHGS